MGEDPRLAALPLDRVGRWLRDVVPGVTPPFRWRLLPGGRSNLSIEAVDASGRALVVRRPPLGTRLATAHDMAREHRIQVGLARAGFPVAGVYAYTDDPAVAGAPCYVMDRVDGVVVRDTATALGLEPAVRHRAGVSTVEALAALHALDVDAAGLGDLARRDGYLERQITRWSRQWAASVVRPDPAFDRVRDRLWERRPPGAGPVLVHGDFRLDNVVVDPAGGVVAVLDWELATLGDPFADLALLLVYWAEPGERDVPLPDPPTAAPGFPDRSEVLQVYGRHAALPELSWYLAFASWKLAAVLEGVDARRRAHPGPGGTVGESFGAVVPWLVETAARHLGQPDPGAGQTAVHPPSTQST